MAQSDEAKHANTDLIIAQLKFKQALKTEDIEARLPPVSVELSAQFFSALDAVLEKNTSIHVQKCTEWIVKHITGSKTRTLVLGGYLVSVSKSVIVVQQLAGKAPSAAPTPVKKAIRNCIDLLLIVNDVLHADKFHRRSNSNHGTFGTECADSIRELVELAASCIREKNTQAEKKLRALLKFWALNQLVSTQDIEVLQKRADEALLLAQGGVRKRHYLLPEYHGDPSAPWHELPASYMLEPLIKYPQRSINPSQIKIAKFGKKEPSPHVRNLLDQFFEKIDLECVPTGKTQTDSDDKEDVPKFPVQTDKYDMWLDPMAQTVKQIKGTEDRAIVSTTYGWSSKFCEDMREHNVPENIKIAREDFQRMGEDEEVREPPQRRREEEGNSSRGRRHEEDDYPNQPRHRRRRSSSGSDYRREHSRDRRGSSVSYDSPRSRSVSRDRSYDRHDRQPKDERRDSDDRRDNYVNNASGQSRRPSQFRGKGSSYSKSRRRGKNRTNRNAGSSGRNYYAVPPQMSQAPQNFGEGSSQAPNPPFPVPPFAPQVGLPGQFPGSFPIGQFPSNLQFPPPLQSQGPGGFMPPPLPPNFSGPFPPPMPNMTAMPSNSYNRGNQFGNHQGNQYGNHQGNQQGNQYANQQGNHHQGNLQGHNQGYDNNGGYGQNSGGFGGGRGGYGPRGNYQRGGYNNRGGYGASQRGPRNCSPRIVPRPLSYCYHAVNHNSTFRTLPIDHGYNLELYNNSQRFCRVMALPKRTRNSKRRESSKRPEYTTSSDSEHSQTASSEWWEADCILEEKVRGRKRQYLIKWKGIDPATGQEYPPNWETEDCANELLVESWEQEKANKGVAGPAGNTGSGSKGKGHLRRQQHALRTPRRNRKSRAVQSSPEPAARSPLLPTVSSTPARDSTTPTVGHSTVTTPVSAPKCSSQRASPRIQIIQRRNSFNREEYDRFSQIAASQQASTQPRTQETDLNSSQLFDAARPFSLHIVPDSQSSAGEGSFIPITQQTGFSSQQSSDIDASQDEKEATQDSVRLHDSHLHIDPITNKELQGIFEIVQAASRAASPATSIPETVPETTADSQSQHRRIDTEDQRVISETLDTFEGASQAAQAVAEDGGPDIDQEYAEQITAEGESERRQEESITQEYDTFPDSVGGAVEEAQVLPGDNPIVIDIGTQSRPPVEDQRTSDRAKEPADDKAHEISQPQSSQQIGPWDSQKSLAKEGNFHLRGSTDVDLGANPVPQTQPAEILVQGSIDSVTVPESSENTPQEPELASTTHNSLSAVIDQPQLDGQQGDSTAEFNHIPQFDTEEAIRRRDFALSPHAPRSSEHSTESREQNAQVLPGEPDFSTQEETTQSIRPSVEEDYIHNRAGSESRHDSSQETPERQLKSVENSSSPIPQPPSQSLDTVASKLPSRPVTPGLITSSSTMASHDTGDDVAQELKERLAKRQAENPFTPKRRIFRSSFTPSATALNPESSAAAPTSAGRFLEANAAEGTRSPSAVPDRSPASQAPTSLRTVAFASNSTVPVAEQHEKEMASSASIAPQQVDINVMVTGEESAMPSHVPTSTEPEDEELSDINDDSESVLNDDLSLEREEYIVPLFIEGRQCDMYTEHLKYKKELLEAFLADTNNFDQLAQVEEVLSHLRALETHIDLVFAEAEPASWVGTNPGTQVEFAAQFGMENSVKFRFLHTLFHHLRDKDKHIVLVTAADNGALFDILETFCRAKFINYSVPTRGRQAIPQNVEGALTVTILPGDSAPVIRSPDLIVCLDGFQEAAQIRQMNWARSSGKDIVPVLHLVIPRSVGHIERYVSPALGHKERLHTILASLAQMHGDIGKPMDEDSPRAPIAAEMVVDWFVAANDDEGLSWPLPSIGSVKNVIEYQTQMSQASHTSAISPVPERNKRPLDDEALDPAKRMRFTPQPQGVPGSNVNHEPGVTHISDSMPGTAANVASLRRQLAQIEEAYRKERDARKAEEQRFSDHEEMWDKQQTVHENLTREYRLLLGQQKSTEEKLETMTTNNETLRNRLADRTTEMKQLNDQLDEQRATHLLSEDEKIAEITRLRQELTTTQAERQKALRNVQTTESTLEYTKEQYRLAQDTATSSQSLMEELTASNAKLQHQASGQPAKLKALHLDRQAENQDRQIKSLRAENLILKRTLGQKEEELQRLRSNPGRAGVGTRAQSVTPQPKVRSRAASPMGGRLSNLRNG
ncbi:hypothetical protein N0V83_000200 [Neocucurbitaria cava]|uniref:Chromo domain-containing protein n=1 Tax=Neocucurbitaria cava TaxID=798079 RepID=A0A9W9CQW6_9PLEO|nr:hypothetical protein N0V83_000200 [Neocucurbitaria cava]